MIKVMKKAKVYTKPAKTTGKPAPKKAPKKACK